MGPEGSSNKLHQAASVMTLADLTPSESKLSPGRQSQPSKTQDHKTAETKHQESQKTELVASVMDDNIVDGTVLPPGKLFTQSWRFKNAGNVSWPAGVSIQCVGGDKMSADTISATTTSHEVAPGTEVVFSIELKAPTKEARNISFWRLVASHGARFGEKVWCDISVDADEAVDILKSSSEMIFPKLPKESIVEEFVDSKSSTGTQDIPESNRTMTDNISDFGEHEFSDDEGFEVLDAASEDGSSISK